MDRIRNDYYAFQFGNWCQCNSNPNAITAPPVTGQAVNACGEAGFQGGVVWVLSVPAGYDGFTIYPITYTVNGVAQTIPDPGLTIRMSSTAIGLFDPAHYELTGNRILPSNPQVQFNYMSTDSYFIGKHIGANYPFWVELEFPTTFDNTQCLAFNYDLIPVPNNPYPYPSPGPAATPANASAIAGCPTVATNQDLANMVCQVQNRLDTISQQLGYLASLTTPPTANPDPAALPAPPAQSVAKPAGAVGCIVQLTALATGTAQYGNPGYVEHAGWAVMQTEWGPLPSVPIKHNPMVLLFPSPLVTSVALDLRAGFNGQVQFLNPPK